MSRKTRRILYFMAMIALALALALLIYVLLPTSSLKEIIPITPTYLIPPAVAP